MFLVDEGRHPRGDLEEHLIDGVVHGGRASLFHAVAVTGRFTAHQHLPGPLLRRGRENIDPLDQHIAVTVEHPQIISLLPRRGSPREAGGFPFPFPLFGVPMNHAQITETARQLYDALRGGPLARQVSAQYPDATLDDANAIKAAVESMRRADGRIVLGRKVGLTSRARQAEMGIAEPDHGVLLDDMRFDDGGGIPAGRFRAPRLEAEIAFVLGEPLRGPNCTVFDVLQATALVTPAIEILDSRIEMVDTETGRSRSIVDAVADNGASGGFILGGRPMRPLDVDLRWVGVLVSRNGWIEETGLGAAVLNHPANSVAWLANALTALGGDEVLPAGQVVLAGSLIRAIPARPGDLFTADFGPLGTVTCRFS